MAKIDGLDVDSIETDTSARTCSFKVKSDVDYKAKLAEVSEGNDHLKDYEIGQ